MAGSGITKRQYNKLVEEYFKTKSVRKAASVAGVGYETAAKYIKKGTKVKPPIAKMVEETEKKELTKALRKYAKELDSRIEQISGMGLALADKLSSQLPNMEYKPQGRFDIDSGKTHVSLQEFNQFVKTLQDVLAIQKTIKSLANESDVPDYPTGVSVNIQNNNQAEAKAEARLSPEQIRNEVLEMRKKFNPVFEQLEGSEEEDRVVEALIPIGEEEDD